MVHLQLVLIGYSNTLDKVRIRKMPVRNLYVQESTVTLAEQLRQRHMNYLKGVQVEQLARLLDMLKQWKVEPVQQQPISSYLKQDEPVSTLVSTSSAGMYQMFKTNSTDELEYLLDKLDEVKLSKRPSGDQGLTKSDSIDISPLSDD